MCSPDIPDPEPLPPPPLVLPVAQYDANAIKARRNRRGDSRSQSQFSAATFATAAGVTGGNPTASRTLAGSI